MGKKKILGFVGSGQSQTIESFNRFYLEKCNQCLWIPVYSQSLAIYFVRRKTVGSSLKLSREFFNLSQIAKFRSGANEKEINISTLTKSQSQPKTKQNRLTVARGNV